MDNNNNGYRALTNLYELDVETISTPSIIAGTIQAVDANITNVTSTNIITQNLVYSTATGTINYVNTITGVQNISYVSATGFQTNTRQLQYQNSTGINSQITNLVYSTCTGTLSHLATITGCNSISYVSGTGFQTNTRQLQYQNSTGTNSFINNLVYSTATGTLSHLATITGCNSISYVSGTGFQTNTRQLQYQNSTGINSQITNLVTTNITGTTGYIGYVESFTGYFRNGLIADTRVVNNYDLLRSIIHKYRPIYQTPNNNPPGNTGPNPQTFLNNFVNGIATSDGNWQQFLFLPNNNNTDIPNGQPYYFRMGSGFGSVIMSDRTSMQSNLTAPGGYTNFVYVFTYNNLTNLYDYQGYVHNTSIPTSNQFNGRSNSFTLPYDRGSSNNVLTSDGLGASSFTSNLNINSITALNINAITAITGVTGYFQNLGAGTIRSSGDISLISSGVDSEIKILTENNRVSKLSLKEFTDSYGFELFYNGATNNLNLNRRNANNVNVYTTSVVDGSTIYNAPMTFNQLMSFSNSTGSNITYISSTGTNTFSNIYRGISYTGASGFFRDLECQNLSSIVVDSNNGNITNLNTKTANINQIFCGTGSFDNFLQADTRVVNNFELLRNISRFYTEVYYSGVTTPTYTDPLVFPSSFQNGLKIEDSSFQSIVYMPARNGIVIPNGQPVYYYMNATNSSSISSIGTNMTSNLTLPGGNVNRTYIFIFNDNTSLFEYQGYLTNYIPGTANQFNGRSNSYILPTNRPAQYNLLSALTNGNTEWTNDILVSNITSTQSSLTNSSITNLSCVNITGTNGYFGNLNTNQDRIHLGDLAGATSQQLWAISIGQEAGRTSQQNVGIAIGYRAGNNSQGQGSIAIGSETGQTSQRNNAVAIGVLCGRTLQRDNSVAIGFNAAQTSQNTSSVAIGHNAAQTSQGSSCVAIGNNAGNSSQELQCIAIGLDCGQISQRNNSIAIGIQSGRSNQNNSSIAIGFQAGGTSQGIDAIAIGDRAGAIRQNTGSIAIGYLAAQSNQSSNCIALGTEAGWDGQNRNSIAIGYRAGYNNQSINSIVINASGNILNTDGADRCFIAPLRNTSKSESMRDMFYNVSTNELTFSIFQDLIGGPIAIGAVYTTLFNMAGNANYLLSINTRANDGNYGLFICYQEEGANGLVVALNQNNILTQTAAGSAVQIRTVNGATYNFYYNAKRLI